MKIGVIGTGLIGGSFALNARHHFPNCMIFGSDCNEHHLKEALSLGLIDKTLKSETLVQLNALVLAIPVDTSEQLLPSILDAIGGDTLVIDVGSVKASICKKISTHPRRNQFLATHPIAGTEFSGPKAAFETLYQGKVQILCETHKTRPDLLEWAKQWFLKMKMDIHEMDPVEHDKHIAYVSHLSHISSFILGKTVMEKEQGEQTIFKMAGSGFASTVRLAKSTPNMWTPIFKLNRTNIIATLSEYIKNLNHFRRHLEGEDYDAVYQLIKNTNAIKGILDGITIECE